MVRNKKRIENVQRPERNTGFGRLTTNNKRTYQE